VRSFVNETADQIGTNSKFGGEDVGVSAALRQMIADRVQAAEGHGEDLLRTDVAVGHSKRINVRLRDREFAILTQAAKNGGTPVPNLIRSIVLNHLAGQKQWNETQSDQRNSRSSWRALCCCS
jgi:hypothetical protein